MTRTAFATNPSTVLLNGQPINAHQGQCLGRQHSKGFTQKNEGGTHNLLSSMKLPLVLVNHAVFPNPRNDSSTLQKESDDLENSKEDYVYPYGEADAESLVNERLRHELAFLVDDLTEKGCHTLLGVINNLVYHLGMSFGAVYRDEDNKLRVSRDRLLEVVGIDVRLVTALSHTVDYLRTYWPNASHNVNRIRAAIDDLQDMGLLDYESHQSKGKVSRAYTYINMPALLVLAELIESRIGYEALPEHGAGLLQKMFNALFSGWGYCRKGQPDTQAPKTYSESVAVRDFVSQQWQGWVRSAYDRAVGAYQSVVDLFGDSSDLAQSAMDEVRRLARLARINQMQTGINQYQGIV